MGAIGLLLQPQMADYDLLTVADDRLLVSTIENDLELDIWKVLVDSSPFRCDKTFAPIVTTQVESETKDKARMIEFDKLFWL